jgi:hypothetical protein
VEDWAVGDVVGGARWTLSEGGQRVVVERACRLEMVLLTVAFAAASSWSCLGLVVFS